MVLRNNSVDAMPLLLLLCIDMVDMILLEIDGDDSELFAARMYLFKRGTLSKPRKWAVSRQGIANTVF